MTDAELMPAPPRPAPRPVPGEAERVTVRVRLGEFEAKYSVVRAQELQRLMEMFCQEIGEPSSNIKFLYRWSEVLGTDTADSVINLGLPCYHNTY